MRSFSFAPAALFIAASCALHAQSFYIVQKVAAYLQTGASTNNWQSYPSVFSISAPGADRLTGPAGSVTIPLSSNKGKLTLAYHSQGEMDSAFPNGTYTFAGPPSYSMTETGDLYPPTVPQVVSSNGTWTNGVLVVDPSQDTVFTFSNFSTYSSGLGGHEQFQYQTQDSSNVRVAQDIATVPLGGFTVTSQPFTTYTIPRNTLKAGTIYEGTLQFDALSFYDAQTVPGGGLLGLYSRAVQFYFVGKPATAAPAISVNPLANVSATAGSKVTIAATGTGLASDLSIAAWYHNGAAIDFSAQSEYSILNGSSLTISNLTASDTGNYYVILISPGGLVVSNEVKVSLAVAPPPVTAPVILAQPTAVNVAGGTVAFNVAASGLGLNYQWYKSGTLLGGATSPRLLLQNVTGLNAASYSCSISNSAGSVLSGPGTLTVTAVDPRLTGRLINESVLSTVATGGSLTVGFTVGGQGVSGSATEPLLVRGVGPTLGALGVPGVAGDPNLGVIPLGSQTASVANDNWGSNSAQIIAADSATGAFPLATGSLDAALVSTFAPHGYSAVVSPNSLGGAVLAEIYDNTVASTYTATSPRMVNLSAIAPVSGNGSLSAGFVVGGSTSRTLLIRAMGPSLTAFGLAGMPDPVLSLVLQSNGTLVASNQGWGGDPTLASIASSVGGFPFVSTTSLDSALVVTVSPGITYTATAMSASGSAGQVLIEVYEVP